MVGPGGAALDEAAGLGAGVDDPLGGVFTGAARGENASSRLKRPSGPTTRWDSKADSATCPIAIAIGAVDTLRPPTWSAFQAMSGSFFASSTVARSATS